MEVTRLFDLLNYTVERDKGALALAGKMAGKWITYTYDDFRKKSLDIAVALRRAGIMNGDRIINIGPNRPEWNFIDMGIQLAGAVHVPVYPVISNEDLGYILNETGARMVFAGNNFIFQKVSALKDQTERLERIISYDRLPGADDLQAFTQGGDDAVLKEKIIHESGSVLPDDLATIIYTSGTTSNPKGVMLSHRNLIADFTAVAPTFLLKPGDKAVSYLPLCHVYERMLNYMYIYCGVEVWYAESLASITENIREVRPHVLTTVPLLLERVFMGIRAKSASLQGKQKRIFDHALRHAMNFPIERDPGLIYRLKSWYYDRKVYCHWRQMLGGRLSRIICGGAALQPMLLKVFWAAGIPVYEGYGLTETSPVISNNSNTAVKRGTVGKILPILSVKIASDGEILVKGPTVMLGYYMQALLTFEHIDRDGYFHTGDIGEIVDGHFLRLTGRKKVLFKSSSGLYISPEAIENKLKQAPLISQVMVVGADQSYLGALIVPDFNYILKWFEEKGIAFSDDEFMARHTLVVREVEKLIEEYNREAMETERIERYEIMTRDWTVDGGELTPKMSLKREVIQQRFREIIAGFFRNDN